MALWFSKDSLNIIHTSSIQYFSIGGQAIASWALRQLRAYANSGAASPGFPVRPGRRGLAASFFYSEGEKKEVEMNNFLKQDRRGRSAKR